MQGAAGDARYWMARVVTMAMVSTLATRMNILWLLRPMILWRKSANVMSFCASKPLCALGDRRKGNLARLRMNMKKSELCCGIALARQGYPTTKLTLLRVLLESCDPVYCS